MSPAQYRLHSVGAQVAQTATAPHYVHIVGVAKPAAPSTPFIVSNELICGHLGRVLGLPVPPGFLVTASGLLHHVSLDFNLTGQPLPPADVPQFVAHDVTLASGIVVFDSWIVNDDRHSQNFAFDTFTQTTTIFDHSHAFMGSGADGRQKLDSHRGALGIGGHAVAPYLPHLDGIKKWIDRVQQVPQFVVENAVRSAVGTGIHDEDVDFCIDFLLERQVSLTELFRADQGRFTSVGGDLWQAF